MTAETKQPIIPQSEQAGNSGLVEKLKEWNRENGRDETVKPPYSLQIVVRGILGLGNPAVPNPDGTTDYFDC